MELAAAQRMEGPSEGEVRAAYEAPRRQKAPLPGMWPAPVSDVAGPRGSTVAPRCQVAGVPSLAMPVLAGRAAELVESSPPPLPRGCCVCGQKEGGGGGGGESVDGARNSTSRGGRGRKKLPKLRILPRGCCWSSSTAVSSLLVPAFPWRPCRWLRHSR